MIDVITEALTPENALSLLASYDIILDCTDNSPTRYLLSDAAVALSKPLVSGAAQKYEGQLCVYNCGEKGPCYRCLFPIPPPKEALESCEESGILGVVTGIIGNMQALETIKLISGLNGKAVLVLHHFAEMLNKPRSVPIDAYLFRCWISSVSHYQAPTSARNMSLQPSRSKPQIYRLCAVLWRSYARLGCSGQCSWISWASYTAKGIFKFSIRNKYRINLKQKDLEALRTSKKSLQIIDVRSPTEYGICRLSGSISEISIATLFASCVMTVNRRRPSQGFDSWTRKVFTSKFRARHIYHMPAGKWLPDCCWIP